jgi:hypothetical protein
MALFSTVEATATFTKVTPQPVEPFQAGREFKTYQDYQNALGSNAIAFKDWVGQDLYWLRRDRELSNRRWHRAAHLITSEKKQNYLQPFAQINSYYKTIYTWVKGKHHEIKWLNGAYYLVNDLTHAYYSGFSRLISLWLTPTPALNLLKSLNLNIANFAITKFYDLLYGIFSNSPRKGVDAWIFDRDFIMHEQGPVAFPAYDGAGPDARSTVSNLFNDQGFLAGVKDFDFTGIYIPVFPQLYNSDLTDVTTNYGQDARIEVPLAMLYPNQFFYTDTTIINEDITAEVTKIAFNNSALAAALKNGERFDKTGATSIPVNDRVIYFAYIVANFNALNVFN